MLSHANDSEGEMLFWEKFYNQSLNLSTSKIMEERHLLFMNVPGKEKN